MKTNLSPRLRKLITKLERCAATEHEGFLDGPLARAIMEEDKRELLSELRKKTAQRLLAAWKELSAEERSDVRAIERAFEKATKDLMIELGIESEK